MTTAEGDNPPSKVQVAPQQTIKALPAHLREIVACHEAGHAVVGTLLAEQGWVRAVSIVPQEQTQGFTVFELTESQRLGLVDRRFLLTELMVALGGRCAEEIMFGPSRATIGASNDIQRATMVASLMVQRAGFNDGIGPMALLPSNAYDLGPELKNRVDRARLKLINRAYRCATSLLTRYKQAVREIADVLLLKNTMDGDEVEAIVRKHAPKLKTKQQEGRTDAAQPPPTNVQ